jgi:hypothetical protein
LDGWPREGFLLGNNRLLKNFAHIRWDFCARKKKGGKGWTVLGKLEKNKEERNHVHSGLVVLRDKLIHGCFVRTEIKERTEKCDIKGEIGF